MNLNSSNAKTVTVKTIWQKTITDFGYTGGEQTFIPTATGYYKLEVWGASGGNAKSGKDSVTYSGGYGGYSVGIINALSNQAIYVYVGGNGSQIGMSTSVNLATASGGYNGGGAASRVWNSEAYKDAGSGGGATHIANKSGLLSTLSASRNSILIVAGGGGGATAYYNPNTNATGIYRLSHGGGIQGVAATETIVAWSSCTPTGGNQTSGGIGCLHYNSTATTTSYAGSFGKGSSYQDATASYGGGGGGWYGGAVGELRGGGGGSGYIGSSSLISGGGITKHMTCYSCTTSTAAATRTNSNTNVSATATADYSKTGNGYARITYLGTSI